MVNYESFRLDENWTAFYGNVKEALSLNAHKPLGRYVELHMFVDSDHAGDKSTRHSPTVLMTFMNMTMVEWYTKKQATVE